MAHDTVTRNIALPPRRWSRPYAIELSDTVADSNLQLNGSPYRWLQNVGTGGKVMISWYDGTLVDIYLATGQEVEGGLWVHAKTTGTGAGVDLRGFVEIGTGRSL